MPTLALQLRAQLSGVTALQPVDAREFRWDVVPKCGSCGETAEKEVWVCSSEEEEVPGGRGTANAVGKCKACGRGYSISVVNSKLAEYNVEDSGQFKTIVAFECRGVELASYKPTGVWQCKGWKAGSEENGGEDKVKRAWLSRHSPRHFGFAAGHCRHRLRSDENAAALAIMKETGTVFNEVDLTDDWADYDERSDASVEILELATQFAVA